MKVRHFPADRTQTRRPVTGFFMRGCFLATFKKEYLEYVLELLRKIEHVTYKKMMGEFLLYKDGVLFGGIYDNRFLLKKMKSFESRSFKDEIPYPSAKAMVLVDSEDPEEIKDLVELVINDLR